MAKHDFLVVGSTTVDVFARTSHVERIDISGARSSERLVCISFGSKTDLERLEIWPGGSAANSAATMQCLGSETALLSCIGDDNLGSLALEDLDKRKIDTSHIFVSKSLRTGVGLNIIPPTGEKSILVYRGANDYLGPEHLHEGLVKSSRCIFVTSLVSSRNFLLFLKLVRLAKRHHRPIIFAPSISMLQTWLPRLRRIHADFALSIFNHEEASYYSGQSKIKQILRPLPGNVDVVSKDADGAYAKEGNAYFHAPVLRVKPVDTCGAGDAFSGAFAHYFYASAKPSVPDALARAICVASLKLSQPGSRLSPRVAADLFVRKNKHKLKIRKL